MLNIGDFARFAGVSARMLRHYDALGLLVPTSVDEFTGYRRYDESLLPRAHRLVALRELGFSLEQIGSLLDGDLPALQAALITRRAELAGQIEADRRRLDEVERRLRLMEGHSMELTFTRKDLPELQVSQITGHVAEQPEVGPVISGYFARLIAASNRPDACDVAWYSMTDDGIEFAACGPAGVAGDGIEQATLQPAADAVVTTYDGPIDGIGEAWQAVGAHLAEQGLEPADRCREVYRTVPSDPADTDARWVIELQQPVR